MPRITIFGASTTWGKLDYEGGGWVDRLKRTLMKVDESIQVYNLGISGNDTWRILQRFESECKTYLHEEFRKDGIILISVGTNDSKYIDNKSHQIPPTQFKKNIRRLIKISRKFVTRLIFVGFNPVDESKTTPLKRKSRAFYLNKYIKKYDNIVKSICKKEKITFLDIFSEWERMNYKQFLADGLHLNERGHERIYKKVFNFLVKNDLVRQPRN